MKDNHVFRSSAFMRTLFVLLFMTVSVQWGFAQLNLNVSRSTLGTVIEQIKSQSKYQFFYDAKLESLTVEGVSVKDASIETALDAILKGQNISYKVENNIVYLSEKDGAPQQGNQQGKERTFTGQVSDDMGPLIGVNVLVKGTSIGCVTDIDGNFKLTTTEANPVIVFSYIGYTTQEVTPTGTAPINIMMSGDSQLIEEVVVTALGIKRAQKALSYNVTQVDAESALAVKDANFINSLNGKVAGLNINASSSGVGGASKVQMRGARGIEQSSNALYVIDGIPMYNLSASGGGEEFQSQGSTEAIADLNPEDIESMSVLSGAAAAALYGSNASNGAIVITTKRGAVGRTSLTFSSNTEMLNPFVMPKFQDRYGTSGTEASWGARLNAGNYYGYNPKDDYFQTGLIGTETVTLSTGTERNQTYASVAAVNSRGIVPNNKYDRYNFTFRNTTQFLNDKMKLDVGAQYIMQKDRNMVNQGIYANPVVSAYLFPRGNDWEEYKMFERFDPERNLYTQYWPQGGGSYRLQNPYWINYRNLRENDKDRYMLSASLSYDILPWLNVGGRVRVDNSINTYTQKYYASTESVIAEGSSNGYYGITNTRDKQTYADFLINVNKNFGEDWSLTANIGTSYSDNRSDALGVSGPIPEDGLANFFTVAQLDKSTNQRTQTGYREQIQSVFASAEIGYKSAYYLTLTGRNDWPSQLAGPNSKQSSFFYPSVGTSFVLSEIFKMPEQISYLKLRASWASVGLPFGRFLAQPTFEWTNATNSFSSQSAYPLYDLKPERTDSWEVGITARFLKYFNLDLSFYNTKTYNQTMDAGLSPTGGYSTFYAQTGNVRNRGVELSLGFKNTWNKFTWNSNYTFSANKNKILSLIDGYVNPVTGEVITKDRMDVGGLSHARFILKNGGSLGDLYSNIDLVRDYNNNIYVDANGQVSTETIDDKFLGSVFPKANMAWRNDFQYGNFSLGFLVSARLGGIVYSASQAVLDSYGVSEATAVARDNGGVVVNGGDVVNAQQWYTVVGADSGIPQYYVYSATNVRLQEASISYTIPRKKLGNVVDLTLSLVGRNLWMIYSKAPFDPEAVASTGNYYQGIDYFMMPSLRSVGFNLKLKF